MSKLLTIFGATGNQGGSVLRTVLAHDELSTIYSIRAITRDPSKPTAQALAAKGCELAKADLNDPASVRAAVEGSYAVFAVTNFWEIFSYEGELAQGKAIADACKSAGVTHLIWSSLPSATAVSNGMLRKAKHYDSKAAVEAYIESIKGNNLVASYYMPAAFMQNVRGSIQPGQDGVPTYSIPLHATATHYPLIDIVSDTGKYVAGLLQAGKAANGVRVQAVGEWMAPSAVTDELTKQTGKTFKYQEISPELFHSFLPPNMADEFTDNMLLIRDFDYYGKGAPKQQAASDAWLLKGTKVTTWPEFVKNNAPWTQ